MYNAVCTIRDYQGEKVFYFIKPTRANMMKYEQWVSSSAQSETFFGDMVDDCYKCCVHPGYTLFIPTGIVNLSICLSVCLYIYTCICVFVHVCMHVCVCVPVCVYVCVSCP